MKLKETSCSCAACQAMCRRCPCWGTPKEMAAIIAAGYADRLSLDYRSEEFKGSYRSVNLLVPAVKGHEGSRAPFWPTGECTFLKPNGLCELHDQGLKPLEGRTAYHNGGTGDDAYEKQFNKLGLRAYLARAWEHPTAVALTEWFQL